MSKRLTLEALKRRGYEMGTHEQVWAALERMAADMEAGRPIDEAEAAWFVRAVKAGSPERSAREFNLAIGLVQPGKPKSVNKFDVADRMVELVGGGMLKEHAAKQVAKEFGCCRATAWHWLKKEGGMA